MKKPQKILGLFGLLVAPLVISALSLALPTLGLVVLFLLGEIFASNFAFEVLLVLAVAAGFGLVGGQSDPFRPFALAVL